MEVGSLMWVKTGGGVSLRVLDVLGLLAPGRRVADFLTSPELAMPGMERGGEVDVSKPTI